MRGACCWLLAFWEPGRPVEPEVEAEAAAEVEEERVHLNSGPLNTRSVSVTDSGSIIRVPVWVAGVWMGVWWCVDGCVVVFVDGWWVCGGVCGWVLEVCGCVVGVCVR